MTTGQTIDDLAIGMSAEVGRTITEADLVLFAGLSGDTNPVHLDEQFAQGTMFKGRIAHGMLAAALISAVLGTRLPGPGAIYISQSLKFLAPVRPGDTVRTTVTVTATDPARRRVTLSTGCRVGATEVVSGEAVLLLPRRPEPIVQT